MEGTHASANTFREIVTDAIRYWETRRLAYNMVLVLVVAAMFVLYWPASAEYFLAGNLSGPVAFMVLAVLANIAFCAAYPVDILMQFSEFRTIWRAYRWVLFGFGLFFASVLTFWFALQFFQPTW